MKTYPWIIATASSNTNKIIWVLIIIKFVLLFIIFPWFPNRVSNKWPAIILAESRIESVIGRIIFLIVSIKIINIISAKGVPVGSRWANILFVFLTHPKIINVNQSGRASVIVITICLVAVKI